MTVAVVGGGITGLAAAHALLERGAEPLVLEAAAELGGVIRTERAGGFLVEAGPESFLTTKPAAVELCAELGLAGQLVPLAAGLPVYVWGRGRLVPIPAGVRLVPGRLGPILRSALFTPREKARIALDLVLPARPPAGDESLGSLVRRRMGRAALDRLAAPLAAGIHAADPDRLSLDATFPHLRTAEREHGSLLRGLAARGPALPPFATLAEGLGALVGRLAARIGPARIRTGARVVAIEPRGPGYRLRLETGPAVEAAAVVLAVPPHAARSLVAPLAAAAARLLDGVPSVTTAVVSLGYRAAEIPALRGSGFVVARDQPARITASTWSSAKWPGRAPAGHALLRAYLGSAVAPLDPGASDGALVAAARVDLGAALGLEAEPVLERVHRWPAGTPQLRPGHRERIEAVRAALGGHPRIALAGAGYGGVGLPDCIAEGRAAAAGTAALLRKLSDGHEIADRLD